MTARNGGSSQAESALRRSLQRAAHTRLLSLILEPPRPGRQAALRAFVEGTPIDLGIDLSPLLDGDDGTVAEEHFSLLGVRGPISCHASDHRDEGFADKGPILADIAGFYRAFGFEGPIREAPDHFANLCGFLAFLALKEGYAAYLGEVEEAQVAREAERALLDTHLHPYLGRFAEQLAGRAPARGVYATVAACAAALEPEEAAAARRGSGEGPREPR
ncbi:MAG: molecular chaperone [Planctomycetota bacterium]